jgi:hypothetical protein
MPDKEVIEAADGPACMVFTGMGGFGIRPEVPRSLFSDQFRFTHRRRGE